MKHDLKWIGFPLGGVLLGMKSREQAVLFEDDSAARIQESSLLSSHMA